MSNVNMQSFFAFLVLVLILPRIRGNTANLTEKTRIAPRALLNNVGEGQGEIVITAKYGENFDDNEAKKLFVRNFKLYIDREGIKNETEAMRLQRKSRDVNTTSHQGLECLSCFANGTSKPDEDCYKGVSVPSVPCAEVENCYTELHPMYIKRGCVLPGRLNRTFVCKCPLCNDKPSFESTHYEYKKISDWEYDNVRLQKPMGGIDVICKVCETRRKNVNLDKACKIGRNADYMVCGRNQLCFTNIDDEIDYVSRGCVSKPAYNSMHFICNTINCNNKVFLNPKSTDTGVMRMRHKRVSRRKMSQLNRGFRTPVNLLNFIYFATISLFTSRIIL